MEYLTVGEVSRINEVLAPTTLDLAPIVCTACDQPFEPEPNEVDD